MSSTLSIFLNDARDLFDDLQGGDLLAFATSPAVVQAASGLAPREPAVIATGASDLPRVEAFTNAALAAMPRIADTLGPQVAGVVIGDEVFDLVARYNDPRSGLSAAQLRSETDGHVVFAIDGTAIGSTADIVTDLDLARPQTTSPAFAELVQAARLVVQVEDRPVVFTGASLGGALAQAAAYETAEARAADPANTGTVTLFTIDSLGGRDATESLNGGHLDSAVLAQMNALNIRTEGDVVSRIGGQIGGVLTFDAVNREGQAVTLSPQDAHVNVESIFTTLSSDELYAAGTREPPQELNVVSAVGNLAGPLVAEAFDRLAGLGIAHDTPEPARLPGVSGFDPTGRFFDIDVNADGQEDMRVFFAGAHPGSSDLLG